MIAGLVVGIAGGLLLVVALLTTRWIWTRRRHGAHADKALTKVYSEDGDVEIDLTTPSAVTVLPSSHHTSPQEVSDT